MPPESVPAAPGSPYGYTRPRLRVHKKGPSFRIISDLDGEVHCNESGPAAQSDNDEAPRKVELKTRRDVGPTKAQ